MKLIYSKEQQSNNGYDSTCTQSYGIIQLLDNEEQCLAVSYRLVHGGMSGEYTYYEYCTNITDAMNKLLEWGLK